MKDRARVYQLLNSALLDANNRLVICNNLYQKWRLMNHIKQLNVALKHFDTEIYDLDKTYL